MEGSIGLDHEERGAPDRESDIISDISEHRSLDSDRRPIGVDEDNTTTDNLPQCFKVHHSQESSAQFKEISVDESDHEGDGQIMNQQSICKEDGKASAEYPDRDINRSLSRSDGGPSYVAGSSDRTHPSVRSNNNSWLRLLPHESRSASVFAALSERHSNKAEWPKSTPRTYGRSHTYSIDVDHHSTTFTEDIMYDQPSHMLTMGNNDVPVFDYPRRNYAGNNNNRHHNPNSRDHIMSDRYSLNEIENFTLTSKHEAQRFSISQQDELVKQHDITGSQELNQTLVNDEASRARDFHSTFDRPETGINSNFSHGIFDGQADDNQLNRSVNSSDSLLDDDMHRASLDSKYESYSCRVDRKQKDKSTEIPLFNFDRPHMRAFHFSWFSFFIAFFMWFSITPILKEVKDSLNLSHQDVWTSSISGAFGTIIFRTVAGPICDRFGSRWVMAVTLVISAIPVMATASIQNTFQLSLLRFLTGISGSAFVTCQYWTSTMFTREVSGTANSIAAGWGNLGGGLAQIIIGSLFFPLFKYAYGSDSDLAWRTTCVVPAIPAIITAFLIIRYSDDSPKGNYHKMKRLGTMQKVSTLKSIQEACKNLNTWILLIHYACCFGVEITMTNAAAIYFSEEFGQTTEKAAAIASIFGWMNLFARGFGGFVSDIMNVRMGMRGRLLWQCISLIAQGSLVIGFSYARDLGSAIGFMAAFSFFVQTSEGSTFSLVPYVFQGATGSVTGLVGAGGSLGGVIFMVIVRQVGYRRAFKTMGWCVIGSAPLSVLMFFKGHASLLCGNDAPEVSSRQPKRTSNQGTSLVDESGMKGRGDVSDGRTVDIAGMQQRDGVPDESI